MNYFLLNLASYMLLLQSKSYAIEPNATVCFENQQLVFFCDEKEYKKAKKACEDIDSYLVKVDNANVTHAVNSLIDRVNCAYREDILVGGFSEDRVWKWLDGSMIYLPSNDTDKYQNWQSGQPNDVGGREDCLILDKWKKQWKDSACSGDPLEAKFYICQKHITINIRVNPLHNGKLCIASAGSCAIHAVWRRDSEYVANSSGRGIYQTQNLNSSVLHEEMATIDDAGWYDCVTWLDDDKTSKNITSVKISVNGTPTIVKINSFACNSNLLVEWKPHNRSIGYPHRITANQIYFPTKFNKSIEVTPTSPDLLFTEINGLNSSTEYNVKVAACKDKDNCTDEYEITQTATTRGKTYSVTNATTHQTNETDDDTCVVTWEWLHDIPATYQITVRHTFPKTPEYSDTEYKNITGKTYSFNPASDQTYEVDVLPVIDTEHCAIPVEAVGECVGKRQHEINPWLIGGLTFIIAVPSAAVGAVLILSIGIVCFCKRTKTSSVDDEVNPGTQVPTDYGHLHSSSNQDEVDAEGSSDGAVAYSTAADPQSFVDGPIYASVYNPKIQVVVEEEGSNEMNISTEQTAASTNTESMVINPIYDMEEASTSTEKNDAAEASFNDPSTSATTEEDQELETEDPIYTAVNKVKMKNNKTIRRPTDEDE